MTAALLATILMAWRGALAGTFGGYDCEADCSRHAAGYLWAEQNDIRDYSACTGAIQSFIEGCKAYVDDPGRGPETDDDGKEIDL